MEITRNTAVYVIDEFSSSIREYEVTEVREISDEKIYLCRSLNRPFIGYSFIPAHIGIKVFLDRNAAEQMLRMA